MLFYYSKKRIPKWEYWRQKGKWTFSVTVGVSVALVILAFFILLFIVSGHSLPIFRMLGASLGMILGGTVLGWMAWYDNEEKYDEWLRSKKQK
jgi:drug/metabolite transporter (DMT)-like permease